MHVNIPVTFTLFVQVKRREVKFHQIKPQKNTFFSLASGIWVLQTNTMPPCRTPEFWWYTKVHLILFLFSAGDQVLQCSSECSVSILWLSLFSLNSSCTPWSVLACSPCFWLYSQWKERKTKNARNTSSLLNLPICSLLVVIFYIPMTQ